VLCSHRGWDPGALEMATILSHALRAPLFSCPSSRLLIEANRSVGHEQLYSEYTRGLSATEKEILINQFYRPYRLSVEQAVSTLPKPVLHLSVHSFTPMWNDVLRDVDIGLLFDPAREPERRFCAQAMQGISGALEGKYVVKFNEPYKGIDDGLTTYLRTVFAEDAYAGIELEINQKYVGLPAWEVISHALAAIVKTLV
ncbi:MAG TPA: N-formylglutamate amidohydrolase, partial [Ohtaekwangia sp.]|nr:N-formylglutamate amidohydrolase [Ohtaekwangia sp.]